MATVEVHHIGVGHGDATLVVNRNLARLKAGIDTHTPGWTAAHPNPLDWMPYAIHTDAAILQGTVDRALLVDGGNDGFGGDVLQYLIDHGVAPDIVPATPHHLRDLEVVLTHPHDDHCAGVRSLLRQKVVTTAPHPVTGKPVTTERFPERFRPRKVYLPHRGPADPVGNLYPQLLGWLDEAAAAVTGAAGTIIIPGTELVYVGHGGYIGPTAAPPTSPVARYSISLGQGRPRPPGRPPIDVALHVLAADRYVHRSKGAPIRVPNKVIDQNDRSIVLLLEYGSFRHFLGGDIAGNGLAAGGNPAGMRMTSTSPGSSTHGDVEVVLMEQMRRALRATATKKANAPTYPRDAYVTVAKANHHGSASSFDVHTLATLQPLVVVFSAGVLQKFHHHPTQQVIDRMALASWPVPGSKTGATVPNSIVGRYATEVPSMAEGKPFTVALKGTEILGDVIIRPTDASVEAIQDAASGANDLTVQVYGTGVQTDFAALPVSGSKPPKTLTNALRPCTPKDPTSAAWYPSGPWEHSDAH